MRSTARRVNQSHAGPVGSGLPLIPMSASLRSSFLVLYHPSPIETVCSLLDSPFLNRRSGMNVMLIQVSPSQLTVSASGDRCRGRMPPRGPGPQPHLESGPSAADPEPVRDPLQPAPAASLPAQRRTAETATRTGKSQPAPSPKTKLASVA